MSDACCCSIIFKSYKMKETINALFSLLFHNEGKICLFWTKDVLKAYLVQCYGHHCFASHAMPHQGDFLVIQVSDKLDNILSHDVVIHLFWVRTVPMVSCISTDDLLKSDFLSNIISNNSREMKYKKKTQDSRTRLTWHCQRAYLLIRAWQLLRRQFHETKANIM